MTSCPCCKREIDAGGKFCGCCGHHLASPTPDLKSANSDHLWLDVLMRYINPSEMRGLLNKTVVVKEGQSALLFMGGRHDRTLGPGLHSIGSILSATTQDASIVLFQTSDATLSVSFPRLLSSDPLPLFMAFQLVLKIEEPTLFVRNLLRGADSFNNFHLSAALYPLVEEGCEAFAGARSIHNLGGALDSSQELSLALAAHLQQPLSRWGLRLVSCQSLGIRSEAWDEINQARTE